MEQIFSIEVVYVGINSELRRYKVVDGNGKFHKLFRSQDEAEQYIAGQS